LNPSGDHCLLLVCRLLVCRLLDCLLLDCLLLGCLLLGCLQWSCLLVLLQLVCLLPVCPLLGCQPLGCQLLVCLLQIRMLPRCHSQRLSSRQPHTLVQPQEINKILMDTRHPSFTQRHAALIYHAARELRAQTHQQPILCSLGVTNLL